MRKSLYFLLIAPGVLLLAVFLFYPLVVILMPTFQERGLSLGRYFAFFSDAYYLKILARTIRIASIATLVCMIFGVPTAYFISRRGKRMKSFLMAVSIFPLLTNSVVRAFAWINILGRNGVVNTLLLKWNLIDEPITLLYTDFSVLIGTIYLFLPLMLITLVGSMDNIEEDVTEAAESLGASRLLAFLKIVLPLSLPGILVGGTLVFTGAITAYTTPNLLGGNKNMLLATLIYQRAMSLSDWTGAGVIAFVMIVMTVAAVKLMQGAAGRLDRR
ncbi:MAG TPA: spermidine/putrescine ABC transporter permease [Treponema sp.]|nr:MAG: spermidine/putrescine ABC transporter permease [Treponema sp. GWC1_61_84]OHE64299.1 MAG: spermidine/putrescine ABC transporter permease [Treponema sp. GWA1_62_8]OHE76282.1 MAG: spermidine/putrescine ABC transporter permease [Treponema sp. RIFOXYC1_FULL_61_9]HCM28812.1 spermidine/putrescine ABC transporter permease [Treponema sp.]